MQNQLQRVINLAKKTGDRVIVFDNLNPDDAYVVMGIEEYEKLAVGKNEVRGLTEDGLIDKINRDIAIWRSDTEFGNNSDYFYSRQEAKNESPKVEIKKVEKIEEVSKPKYSATSFRSVNEVIENKNNNKKNHWSIPKEIKLAAAEVKKEDEGEEMEEDRGYLGDIKF